MLTNAAIVFLCIGILCLIFAYWYSTSREYISDDHPILDEVRERFRKLNPKYGDIPLKKGSSAYTENKRAITLCLKDPHSNKYYSMNTIMYVALHELAHVITKSHGHGEEFKRNFKQLLDKATQIGIYNPSIPIPNTYCGVDN